jgi:hypothetical protein
MEWDSITETKQKNKDFIGGESLIPLKAFVASLPDQLAENMTARINIELFIYK